MYLATKCHNVWNWLPNGSAKIDVYIHYIYGNMLNIVDLDEVYRYILHYHFDLYVCLKTEITK